MDQTVKWPIGYLLSPYVWLPTLILFLNDHYLKWLFPGFFTGKLSDFLGVFVLPIFLSATWNIVTGSAATTKVFIFSATFTVALMLFLKLIPGGGEVYLRVLNFFGARGYSVRDPWDLVSLVMIWPCYRFLRPTLK